MAPRDSRSSNPVFRPRAAQAPAESAHGADNIVIRLSQLFLPDGGNRLTAMKFLNGHHLNCFFPHLFGRHLFSPV